MKSAAVKALLIASLRTADPIGTSRRVVAGLAIHATAGADKLQPFRKAMAADTAPLGEALWEAIQTTDPVAMRAGLRKIARRMGDFTTADALGEELSLAMAEAFIAGAAAESPLEAKGNREGALKGWDTRRGRGWSRERKDKATRDHFGPRYRVGMTEAEAGERLAKVIRHAVKQRTSMHSAAWRKELGRIDLPWGTPGDRSNDFKGGKGLSHVLEKHAAKDVAKLPAVLSRGIVTVSAKSPEKREVRLDGFVAVLVQDKPSRSWLLTGFTKEP